MSDKKVIEKSVNIKVVDFISNASKYPVIPTKIEGEWKPVFIINGIQTISNCCPTYKNFETALRACDVHNQFAGLNKEQIIELYNQNRM